MDNRYIPKDDMREVNRLKRLGASVKEISIDAILKAGISSKQNILDIGCGIGTLSAEMAKINSQATITGVDISNKFIEYAKAHILDTRVNFVQSSADNLPFPDNSFDFVVCRFLLEHVNDRIKTINEIKRVLKIGGVVLAIETDWQGQMMYPECKLYTKLNGIAYRLQKMKGGDVYIGRKMNNLFHKLNFTIIDFYCEMNVYRSDQTNIGKDKINGRLEIFEKIMWNKKIFGFFLKQCISKIRVFMEKDEWILTDCRYILIAKKE